MEKGLSQRSDSVLTATMALLAWCFIAFLQSSCRRFSALSRRFHCTFTVLSMCALGVHSVCTALTAFRRHSQKCLAISMQTPQTTTAIAQRHLCAHVELLLRCRKHNCAAMATLQRPPAPLLESRAKAFVLCMLKMCAFILRSM